MCFSICTAHGPNSKSFAEEIIRLYPNLNANSIEIFAGKKLWKLEESDIAELCRYESLQELKIMGGSYSEFPENIIFLRELEHLSILKVGYNDLNSLNQQFAGLDNLKVLSFLKQKFKEIPSAICSMDHLEHLAINNDEIRKITCDFRGFLSLRELSFSGNKIEEFDPKKLPIHLELLDLSYNNIGSIPKSISRLKNLKYLYLGNNNIQVIPVELFEIKTLQYVDLRYNGVKELPVSEDKIGPVDIRF